MSDIYQTLKNLNINYQKYEHPAVFTNEESGNINIEAVQKNAKNLFLRAEKTHQFYLLTIKHDKRADLKAFAKTVGEKSFSFGNAEELKQLLNLTPGSVSPLGLINDATNSVYFYIDADLLKDEVIYCHPNINTATLEIKIDDFKKIIDYTGHKLNTY